LKPREQRVSHLTFASGTSIPMHSRKTLPEMSFVTQGTLANKLQG
jgi:quercetin dioxygenase-like cupin family protein